MIGYSWAGKHRKRSTKVRWFHRAAKPIWAVCLTLQTGKYEWNVTQFYHMDEWDCDYVSMNCGQQKSSKAKKIRHSDVGFCIDLPHQSLPLLIYSTILHSRMTINSLHSAVDTEVIYRSLSPAAATNLLAHLLTSHSAALTSLPEADQRQERGQLCVNLYCDVFTVVWHFQQLGGDNKN